MLSIRVSSCFVQLLSFTACEDQLQALLSYRCRCDKLHPSSAIRALDTNCWTYSSSCGSKVPLALWGTSGRSWWRTWWSIPPEVPQPPQHSPAPYSQSNPQASAEWTQVPTQAHNQSQFWEMVTKLSTYSLLDGELSQTIVSVGDWLVWVSCLFLFELSDVDAASSQEWLQRWISLLFCHFLSLECDLVGLVDDGMCLPPFLFYGTQK